MSFINYSNKKLTLAYIMNKWELRLLVSKNLPNIICVPLKKELC